MPFLRKKVLSKAFDGHMVCYIIMTILLWVLRSVQKASSSEVSSVKSYVKKVDASLVCIRIGFEIA